MVRVPRGAILLAVAAIAVLSTHEAASGALPSAARPAPSLEPRATEALWQRLVERGGVARPLAVEAECRPLRAVFYAATDWLRLATRLAAQASPCAQYYVSVPPVVGDKTRLRPDQAGRIRALGPSFHALAEIHLTAWQKWVASTGSSWYQAGVEARRRMAAAGYDVGAGDLWALNELSSAVRRGDGTWRTDVRELLRGLFDAAGEGPPTRGVVFVVGVGQRPTDGGATYKARLQEWLQDSAFWVDMNAYVGDWSQEAYGDLRTYAAPGVPLETRREALVEYLRHSDLLAAAGGAASGTANAFLGNAGSALANAAWQWESAFGWTFAPYDLMQHYVSAQVYALRSHGVRAGRATDRFGFAWAPRNQSAMPAADFAAQTGEVLDRLAAAIRDSAADVPADPGAAACGADGLRTWCGGDLDGASLTPIWRAFRMWSPTTLAFPGAPAAVGAGVVSAPLPMQAQVAGVAARPLAPVAATVSTSSPTGLLSTSAAGPFAPTVTVTLPAGAFATAPLYYQDTTAGPVTITASAAGVVTGTHQLTVGGSEPVSLRVDPPTASVAAGAAVELAAVAVDRFGNETPASSAAWVAAPVAGGSVLPPAGPRTTFTAGTRPGPVAVTATLSTTAGTLTATATVTVTAPPAVRVSAVRYGVARKRLHVYVTVVDRRGIRKRNARVTVALHRNGKVYARAAGSTASGRMTFSRAAAAGTYRVRVTRVAASGFVWDGKTPPNLFRRPARR